MMYKYIETNDESLLGTLRCDQEGYVSVDGGLNCYKLFTETKTWSDAQRYCEQNQQGHLVSISDPSEQGIH